MATLWNCAGFYKVAINGDPTILYLRIKLRGGETAGEFVFHAVRDLYAINQLRQLIGLHRLILRQLLGIIRGQIAFLILRHRCLASLFVINQMVLIIL